MLYILKYIYVKVLHISYAVARNNQEYDIKFETNSRYLKKSIFDVNPRKLRILTVIFTMVLKK
jgi:hypothetical protein